MMEIPEVEFKERGVNGRNIVVLHSDDPRKPDKVTRDGHKALDPVKELESESPTASSSSSGKGQKNIEPNFERPPQKSLPFLREVTFADDAKDDTALNSPMPRFPERLSPEQHIAFLENQRNPKDKGTLRIPGPRDFDRGEMPEPLALGEDGEPLREQITSPVDRNGAALETPIKRSVTIEDPKHPHLRSDTNTLSKNKSNNAETSSVVPPDDQISAALFRSRTNTFKSLRRSNTSQDKDPMPYLSWQPTIGRNSAFVDLTEEQREELGGIEYRSLKTLAIVLVCKSSIAGLLTGFDALSRTTAYYVLFHLLGVVVFLPWILETDRWGSIVSGYGVNRTWWYVVKNTASGW